MARTPRLVSGLFVLLLLLAPRLARPLEAGTPGDPAEPLAGTEPLRPEGDPEGDIASALVAGVDRFLLRKLELAPAERDRGWAADRSSPEAWARSLDPARERLARILGVRDPRAAPPEMRPDATASRGSLVENREGYRIHAVRWPAFGDVEGEGLLLEPFEPVACVVAIPDADVTPEALCGLAPGVDPDSRFPRKLAERRCRVIVPALIDRGVTHRNLSNREFLYRSAFELGRHIIGYEVQKVLAAVDWLVEDRKAAPLPIAVFGHGEGGLIALHAAALDPRISAACVSGHFAPREDVWKEPVYRNVFGLLREFGDAELACMIAPRHLVVEAAKGPEVVVPPGTGGAPGVLSTPPLEAVRREVERARAKLGGMDGSVRLVASGDGSGPPGSDAAVLALLESLGVPAEAIPTPSILLPADESPPPDPAARLRRQLHRLDRHNQELLEESPYVREGFLTKLDRSSLKRFEATVEPYRKLFEEEVIGRFEDERLPPRPRSRRVHDEERYLGYEVVLDVFPDVIAYGILLVPKGIPEGERRPVVVCQHGLEGRPRDVADPKVQNPAYNRYACRLAEKGFVTFAPQNLYIFGDRFRTLQRKANPLGKTLFSVIVPQHRQIVEWLGSLPFVDPARIAFYGLSYGGKTAMRVPPLVEGYCLSICSADFNDWVWKNASSRAPHSYVWTGEYEIFEFDLGSTFNYSEMAALIAPRPFMVERGHFDGVAPDERVALEFAKVRHLYQAKLGIGDRCRIEWFVGPHTIHGVGTFEFLEEKLGWPREDRSP